MANPTGINQYTKGGGVKSFGIKAGGYKVGYKPTIRKQGFQSIHFGKIAVAKGKGSR